MFLPRVKELEKECKALDHFIYKFSCYLELKFSSVLCTMKMWMTVIAVMAQF